MIKTGIYVFTNKTNGKKYIGQSINIYDRYSQHKHRYDTIKNKPVACIQKLLNKMKRRERAWKTS